MKHHKMAKEVWNLIFAILPMEELNLTPEDKAVFDKMATELIETACDCAAESQRVAMSRLPLGVGNHEVH
jgi:hypothetical protein